MKKALLGGALLASLVLLMATPAWADDDGSPIPWEGNGSENLPCEFGGHWVLAPAHEVETATLFVDGVSYPMTQSGEGSFSADSIGPIDSDVVAYVEFTGDGDEGNHLQLSHCTQGESPSPTETPSPSVLPTTHEKCEGHGQDRDKCQTATKTAPPAVAFTGISGGDAAKLAGLALGLALIGTFLLRLGRKRASA